MKKSRTILRVLAALMAVMLMTMSGAPALAASFKAYVNSSAAKVYNVPSTSSKIYVQGGLGKVVNVTGYSNGWARITYRGNTGYTPVRNLNLVNRPVGYTKKSTPVYRQASTSSSRMGTLSMGSSVYVCGVSGNFYRVQNASGSVTGYVQKGTLATKSAMTAAYKKYLAYMAATGNTGTGTAKPSTPSGGGSSSGSGSSSGNTGTGTVITPSTPSGGGSSGGSTENLSAADRIIQEALKHLGKSYAMPSDEPNTFNCSTYVKYVFKQFGIDMKSSAAEQCADGRYKLITNISDIQRGDVLCFDTTESDDANGRKCDHTAIYYGSNAFLESSQKAGMVKLNTMTDWYRSRFICARRAI